MYNVQTAESAPSVSCKITLRSAINTYAFHCNGITKIKLSPKENQYALTVIDILTNYTWCIPLNTKEADEVVHA